MNLKNELCRKKNKKTLKINPMQKLKLIQDEFSPSEFKEVLHHLFLKKIEFYKIKNFSSQIRFGIDDAIAVQRIAELSQSIKKMSELFEEAKEENHKLIVSSEIQIRLATNTTFSQIQSN